MDKIDIKKLRKILKDYYESKQKGWWNKTLKWLKETYGFPKIYPIPHNMQVDYHPVFRDLLYSPFPIPENGEGSATDRLVAFSRKEDLFNMRILPHYFGIFDPFYSSRSVNNFGLVNMKVDKEHGQGIFCRATLNCPYFFKQKIKRMIIEAYGVTKNGKNIDNIDEYPKGGLFLINPDKDKKWESLTPYCDYSYVTLKVRLPKNYKEFVKTIDGSVLISKSAKEKLKYLRRGYAIIRNPHPKITKKILFFKKTKIPSEGAYIKFQEPLSIMRIGKEELPIQTSPSQGYITKAELMTPQIQDDERKIWKLTIEEVRDAELGLKLESATGLKCTIAGYTNDKEPTIVINPDQLKDRSMYWEIKDFGVVHCYPAVAGKDGNISNKDIKISKTLLQGIFCYPPDVQKKIIEQIFCKENLSFPFPKNIIEILENLHKIHPEKLLKKYPVFFPYLYYIRRKKMSDGSIRFYEEKTKTMRALGKLYEVKDYDKLDKFYQQALDEFVNTIIKKLVICNSSKNCAIKINGYLRIVLFDDMNINEIKMSKDLWEEMGKPEYVIWGKEPISRATSLRCLKVVVDKTLENQVVRVSPYLGKDYDDPDSFNTKVDSVREDTPIIVRNTKTGKIEIKRIDDLVKFSDKELERVPVKDLEVLTEQGFKKIYCIYRHKVNKKGYQIRTINGFVEVTEDHSLMIDGKKVSPKELSVGSKINTVPLKINNPIKLDPDIAWLYGFFIAEGFCNCYVRKNGKKGDTRYEWRISNKDKSLLEKAQKVMKKLGYETEIKDYPSNYGIYVLKLKAKYKGQNKEVVTKFREMFYTKNDKKVPSEILMADKESKKAFLEGLIDGDGHRYKNGKISITAKSKSEVAGICNILEELGYTYTIHYRKSKNAFSININLSTKDKKLGNRPLKERNIIQRLEKFDLEDEYVYDITTETGTFVGGIGNILLHNTDGDLCLLIPIKEPIKKMMYPIKYKKFKKYYNKWKKYKTFEDLPEPPYDYKLEEIITEIYDYQRLRSLDQLCVQELGGIKNRAMFTDYIKNYKEWQKIVEEYDIEYVVFQAEKQNPELKDASYWEQGNYRLQILKKARSEGRTKFAKLHPDCESYFEMEKFKYKDIPKIRDKIKMLKKSKHPIMKLFYHIYEELEIVPKSWFPF